MYRVIHAASEKKSRLQGDIEKVSKKAEEKDKEFQ